MIFNTAHITYKSISLMSLAFFLCVSLKAQINLIPDSSSYQEFKPFSLEKIHLKKTDSLLYIQNLEIDTNGILWIIGNTTLLYDGQQTYYRHEADIYDLAAHPYIIQTTSLNDSITSLNEQKKNVTSSLNSRIFNCFAGNNSWFEVRKGKIFEYSNGKVFQTYTWPFSDSSALILDYHPQQKRTYIFQSGNLFELSCTAIGKPNLKHLMGGIDVKNVNALKKDLKTGVLFLSTTQGGVYKLYPRYFSNWYKKGEHNEGINNVYEVIELGEDSIFSSNGIVFTPDTTYTLTAPVSALKKDLHGRIWGMKPVLENGKHITKKICIDVKKDFKITQYNYNDEIPFEDTYVTDSTQTVWFFVPKRGSNPVRLEYYNPSQNVNLQSIVLDSNIQFINYLYYNKTKHSLLLGAWGDTSLNFFEFNIAAYQNGDSSYFKLKKGLIASFSLLIRDLHLDRNDLYWNCFRGNGYNVDFRDSTYALPMDKNTFLKYPHQILENEDDYFWISTNNGIIKAYRPELMAWVKGETDQVYYHHYGYENGIESRELNGFTAQSGTICKNGNFIFPSIRGIIVFNPDNIPETQTASKIILSRFNADGQKLNFTDNIKISPYFSVLEFQFSAPFFGSFKNQPQIEYKINNKGSKWLYLQQNHKLALNNLPPGTYHLQLRLKAGFGINNYVYRDFTFKVTEVWYTSSAFKYSLLLLFLLLIGGYFWFRSALARKTQMELEVEVKKQTHVQFNLHNELKFKNAQLNKIQTQNEKLLRSRDRLIGLYIHDIRGPLHFLSNVAESTRLDIEHLTLAKYQKRIEMLTNASNGIFSQSERMYKWITSENRILNQKLEKINLKNLIEECSSNFTQIANNKGLLIQSNISSKLSLYSDINIVTITIGNILDNAIKFSNPNSTIKITAIEQDSFISVHIVDEGIGMSHEQVEKLSKGVTQQSNSGTKGEKGKGYGIKAIHELIDLIGVLIEIESELNHGTSVTLFFPKQGKKIQVFK